MAFDFSRLAKKLSELADFLDVSTHLRATSRTAISVSAKAPALPSAIHIEIMMVYDTRAKAANNDVEKVVGHLVSLMILPPLLAGVPIPPLSGNKISLYRQGTP